MAALDAMTAPEMPMPVSPSAMTDGLITLDSTATPGDPDLTRTFQETPQVEAEVEFEVEAAPVPVIVDDADAAAMPSVPPPSSFYPIDLPTALRLADAENPTIGEARARINEAIALYQGKRVALLPNLNAGANYHAHDGPLQRSSGEILRVSRQSLYVGGGARAVAAETAGVPAINLVSHLADALYDPLAARQEVDRSRSDARATAHETLLEVASIYLELQGALARLDARSRTVGEAERVAEINAEYAEIGEGRKADARRAETQWRLRQAEVREAEEQAAVAAARLASRLHLDTDVRIEPVGDPLAIFELVSLETPVEELLATAVARRPEIAAGSAAMAAASTRVRQEFARPLLPTLWVGLSGAAFGGGSNLVPPLVGDFRGRSDVDVRAYWTLQNFGAGNRATQRRRKAEQGIATADRARVISRVRGEVAAARGDALAHRQRIAIAVDELDTAEQGFLRDLDLILEAVDRPIEVLDSLGLLRDAREALIDAVVGYNQAQFRLFVALGSPPPLATPSTPAPAQPAMPIMLDTDPTVTPTVIDEVEVGADLAEIPSPTIEVSSHESMTRMTADPPCNVGGAADAAPMGEATAESLPLIDAVAEAHEAALAAALEYDRVQARLQSAIEEDPNAPEAGSEAIRRDLQALDRAHRRVIEAEIEFDRRRRRLGLGLLGEPAPGEHVLSD